MREQKRTIKVWKIKLKTKRQKEVDLNTLTDVLLTFRPTRSSGLAHLKSNQERPKSQWTLQGLFGWWVFNYEKRYRREWRFTQGAGFDVVKELGRFAARVGMGEAVAAVEILFTKLKWVNGRHMAFLEDVDRYETHVAPHLGAKAPGEQAEWRGVEDRIGIVDPVKFFR